MMINILWWVARRRVAVVAVSLTAAVILQMFRETAGDGHSLGLNLAISVLPVTLLVLGAAVAARVFHPAKLIARPEIPAFDVPVNPAVVLGAASYTFFVVFISSGTLQRLVKGLDPMFAAPVVLIIGGQLVALWWAALGRHGVRLTPDGIIDRQAYGRMFVPWEALATPDPAYAHGPHQVTLRIRRPDSVRRRGFRIGGRALLPAAGVSAELLTRAINEYANHPEARPTIGSEVALSYLQVIPQTMRPVDQT